MWKPKRHPYFFLTFYKCRCAIQYRRMRCVLEKAFRLIGQEKQTRTRILLNGILRITKTCGCWASATVTAFLAIQSQTTSKSGSLVYFVVQYFLIENLAEKEFKKLARRGSVTHAIKNVEETKDALGGLLAESKQVRAQLIKEAVEKTNQELYAQEFDTKFSGSTMVFTLLLGKSIVCGNIGDSRAVIASHKQRGTGKIWIATPLSRDHKPDLPDEERRILNSNGRIEAFKDLFGNSIGPARVWLRNETYPGLAMSRSLGDKAARQCGVTELPEVTEKPLTAEDKVVIIGSDGIWEFITNIQAVEMVVPFWLNKDVEGACDKLVNEATSRWEKADASIDDITCIVTANMATIQIQQIMTLLLVIQVIVNNKGNVQTIQVNTPQLGLPKPSPLSHMTTQSPQNPDCNSRQQLRQQPRFHLSFCQKRLRCRQQSNNVSHNASITKRSYVWSLRRNLGCYLLLR
eukprot:TRINITY_DN102_c1_g1_i2.p1 TRINITY_DN102_c1_g1~~TRINITY_DN102_c1_g1_i2.p1  ORF type:complete len:461 (+),score=-10.16 TRINITY_DN102_c1_g1_i2:1068-2450(+)